MCRPYHKLSLAQRLETANSNKSEKNTSSIKLFKLFFCEHNAHKSTQESVALVGDGVVTNQTKPTF